MSWLFSQALVEAFSGASSSDGEPCAPLSVMPTPHKFYRLDKMMEPSNLSRFGLMCAVLTEDRGLELLRSFRAAFPARTSAQQGRAQASTENAPASGLNLLGSLARWDRDSCSWRTPQCSLVEGLDEFSETWPRWGSMRSGVCWGRTMPELHTSENGSGYWPTPRATDGSHGGPNQRGREPRSYFLTPRATDTGKGEGSETFVKRMGDRTEDCFQSLPSQVGGQLNPPWVEWLMGWPIGWTDLKPLETARSRKWPHSHSEPSTAA